MKWWLAGATLLISNATIAIAGTELRAASDPSHIADVRCETPSEALLRLGDNYFDPAPLNAPSSTDIQTLQNLYHRMQGPWVGRITDTYCLGNGESTRMESRTFLLKRVEAMLNDKDLFIIRGEKHLIEKRPGSNRFRTVSITPGSRMDYFSGYDLSSLDIENDNTVSMTARFRQNNRRSLLSTGLTTLRERQDRITLHQDTLEIQTRYFSNGYFTGFDTVQLKRP